jgi:hypothetical protein
MPLEGSLKRSLIKASAPNFPIPDPLIDAAASLANNK